MSIAGEDEADGPRVATARGQETGEIVRPHGMGIASADFSTVAWLGRDIHVSLFAFNPHVTKLSGFSPATVGPSEIEFSQTYLESAKLRFSPSAAAHLAGNLLYTLSTADPDMFKEAARNIVPMMQAALNEGEDK